MGADYQIQAQARLRRAVQALRNSGAVHILVEMSSPYADVRVHRDGRVTCANDGTRVLSLEAMLAEVKVDV